MKVFVVGVTPPPFGGVSIHVKRFSEYCWANSGRYTLGVFDYKKRNISLKGEKGGLLSAILFWLSSDVVHVHMSGNMKILVMLVSRFLRKRVVYTHHNSIVSNRRIFRFTCKLCHAIILVNSEKVISAFRSEKDRSKVYEIPAFLPPVEMDVLPEELSNEISKFEKIVSTNCSSANCFRGEEVYGISRLVELFCEMAGKNLFKNVALLICDPSGSYKEKIDWEELRGLDNGNGVIYWGKPVDFSRVVSISSCTVRPTVTDGDSISVRESLYFRVPAVASDCVTRPTGTLTYRTLNDEDLGGKLLSAILNKDDGICSQPNYADKIIEVYDRLSNF